MRISNSKERIKELLSQLNVTQTDFCKKTGINKSALSNYLNGDRVPRQDQVSKIADAYNISAAWLIGYDVPMNEEALMERMKKTIGEDGVNRDDIDNLTVRAFRVAQKFDKASDDIKSEIELLLDGWRPLIGRGKT